MEPLGHAPLASICREAGELNEVIHFSLLPHPSECPPRMASEVKPTPGHRPPAPAPRKERLRDTQAAPALPARMGGQKPGEDTFGK